MRVLISCTPENVSTITDAIGRIDGIELAPAAATHRMDATVLAAIIGGGSAVVAALIQGIFAVIAAKRGAKPDEGKKSIVLVFEGQDPVEIEVSRLEAQLASLEEGGQLASVTEIVV